MMKKNIETLSNPSHLLSYWRKEWLVFLFIALFGLLYNLGMLFNPYFEGILIDFFLEEKQSANSILPLLLIYLVGIFLIQFFRMAKRYLVRRFANEVTCMMRKNLFNNLLHESYEEIAHEDMGTLLNRLQSDCNESVEGMRKLTTEIFDTVFLFLFYIVYIFFYDVKMSLFALIPVAVSILVSFLMRKVIFKYSSLSKKSNAMLSKMTYEMMDHAWMYRLYSLDEKNENKYDDSLKDYERNMVKSEVLTDITLPICNVISLIGLIPILYLGIGYVSSSASFSYSLPYLMKDNWTIGAFSTYITTFVLLSSKASHTAKLFSSIEKGLSSWKRIKPYIKPYEEFSKAEEREGDSLLMKDFSISFDEKRLFEPFSLEARKGEIIALTGPVACGKTAIGKAFLKVAPYSGSLRLFGKEIHDYTLEERNGNLSYMGHQNNLFTESIKNNISYGEEKSVMDYLSMVSFSEDMENMPLKEETIVGNEGIRLSGGQQERIALARTFYHKKGMIILDDPFSNVDVRTEHEIMMRLKKEACDSILLLFSHRLSYFPYCDKVVCIHKDGSVVCSTHSELMEEDEEYKNLFLMQKSEVEHE